MRIPDIDTNPRIYHVTATQRTRQTVCISDTDNTPWRNHSDDVIPNWTDDTEQISWHNSPLITDDTTEQTTPTLDTSNDRSLCTPPLDDDTFTDFDDTYYTSTNDDHEIPSPSPHSTKAASVTCHPHPPFPLQLDISTFATQNTHGLRRCPRDTDG